MSNFSSLNQVIQGLPGTAPNIFLASTPDLLATLIVPGYLNDLAKIFKATDIVYVNIGDTSTFPVNPGESALRIQFQVTVSGGNTSLVQASGRFTLSSLTAKAGGGQSGATQLYVGVNQVTTVATAADSVLLPIPAPGVEVVVTNAAATNAMAVFPSTGGIINALSANASISVAAGKTIVFYALSGTQWYSVLTA